MNVDLNPANQIQKEHARQNARKYTHSRHEV